MTHYIDCPECGNDEFVHDVRDVEFEVSPTDKFSVKGLTGYFCTRCNESVLGVEEANRFLRAFETRHTV